MGDHDGPEYAKRPLILLTLLEGYTEEDIADAADWAQDAGEFVTTLVETGWLDRDAAGVFALHDWADHQPWLMKSEERTEIARAAANQRHGKKQKQQEPGATVGQGELDIPLVVCSEHAPSMHDACGAHANGNAGSNAPLLSSPSLSHPILSSPNPSHPSLSQPGEEPRTHRAAVDSIPVGAVEPVEKSKAVETRGYPGFEQFWKQEDRVLQRKKAAALREWIANGCEAIADRVIKARGEELEDWYRYLRLKRDGPTANGEVAVFAPRPQDAWKWIGRKAWEDREPG